MTQQLAFHSKKLLDVLHRLSQGGLLSGTSGNVSICLRRYHKGGLILITPSQRLYQSLREEDLVLVNFDGVVIRGDLMPSSEIDVHLEIYKKRYDVNSVMHTHSTHASILAIGTVGLELILDELLLRIGGEVKIAEYGVPGTLDLAHKLVTALGDRNAVLMKNHGVVSVGNSLEEAFQICDLVERSSEVLVTSRLVGGLNLVPSNGVELESKIYRKRFSLLSDYGM